jgi:hypothetical protein
MRTLGLARKPIFFHRVAPVSTAAGLPAYVKALSAVVDGCCRKIF